jgi:hypothetical protein
MCDECGANNSLQAGRCWLCGRELPLVPEVVADQLAAAYRSPSAEPFADDPASSITSLMVVVVVLLIGGSIALEEVGLAIAYFIIAAPALLGMFIAQSKFAAKGQPLGPLGRIAAFFVSAAAAFALLTALGIAAAVAFFIYCLVEGMGGGTLF